MKVAVHNDDIDGIASAALILHAHPNANIKFLSVYEAQNTMEYFDYVIDLPKPINAKTNIDHHRTNYERLLSEKRLSPNDLIDPSAPSATCLVAKYFNLNSNIAREIVDMANKADTGHLDDKLMVLDKLIKYYVTDQKILRKLAEILSKKGKKFIEDDFIKALWSKVSRDLEKGERLIMENVNNLVKRKIEYAIVIIAPSIPYMLAKDAAYHFLKKGGKAVAVIYKDPNTGKDRVSFRIGDGCDIDASVLAERLGGGGHKKASGALLDNVANAILVILEEFSNRGIVGFLRIGD